MFTPPSVLNRLTMSHLFNYPLYMRNNQSKMSVTFIIKH